MKGFGAMISFEPKGTPDQVDLMCDSSKLITNATSLGGVNPFGSAGVGGKQRVKRFQ